MDYLTKTQARNKGEVTQYYIEDNHQGIVSKEIFDMVQNEIQKRANLYCGDKKSKHSKYPLSGKVICGKCGSTYRRVVWTGGGNRRVVWRCIERLNYGIKKCRYSPTIYEDVLHNAILNNIQFILKNADDVKETVKREIEAVMFKENEYNPRVIKANIRKYEKELYMLRNILKETEDKEFYIEIIHTVESQIAELNNKLKNAISPDNIIMKQIEGIIDNTDLNMNEYFNQLVRTLIETIIIISDDTIKIKYVGGTEIEATL